MKLIPDNLKLLGKAIEVFKDGLVFILKIENIHIKVCDSLIISLDDSFQRVKIMNLQFNNSDVDEACSGEIGFLIDKLIKKNSLIYIEMAG